MKTKPETTKTRVPHEKSRNGCYHCKTRKIKCDEVHPSCLNCGKKGLKCIFPLTVSSTPVIGLVDCNKLAQIYDLEVPRIKKRVNEWAEKNGATPQLQLSNSLNTDIKTSLVKRNKKRRSESPGAIQVNEMSLSIRNVQLPSNSAEEAFPSYSSSTFMNSKAVIYYGSVFYYRVSPYVEQYLPWSGVAGFLNAYPETYSITLSLMFLSMYHDTFSEEQFPNDGVEFKNLNDYLVISQLNYTLYHSQLVESKNRLVRDASELFAELLQLRMELLTMLYSPSLTISDCFFVKRAIFTEFFTKEMIQVMVSPPLNFNHIPLNYYSGSSYPTITENCKTYFPKYLFQLCEDIHMAECDSLSSVSPSSSDITQSSTPSSIEEILRVSMDYDITNPTKETFERDIHLAVKSLEREYIQYNNELFPEMDGMRLFCRWPATLSHGFATLLAHQDNRALIVMAHFLMLLASQKFKGLFPKKLIIGEISNIESVLADSYKGWLLLPKRVVGMI